MLANISVILVLIFGIYTTYKTEYFTKVTNTLTYVSQHITPQDLEKPEGNDYQKESATFINLAVTYGSIISVFAIATYYSDAAIKEYIKSKSNQDCNEKITQEA